MEGEQVSCIASSDSLSELVLGKEDGSVQVWATGKWDLKVSFHSSSGGTVTSLHYCAFRLKQKVETFLIVSIILYTINHGCSFCFYLIHVYSCHQHTCQPIMWLSLITPSNIP